MSKQKRNSSGFGAIEAILIIVIVVVLIGVGWYIYRSNKRTDDVADNNNDTAEVMSPSQSSKEERKNSSYTSFSVTPSEKLKEMGSCKSGEALFAPIFNAESHDYDCNGLQSALEYASIVFGESDTNILGVLGKPDTKGKEVKLSNDVIAEKYEFEAKRKGHGTNDEFSYRYTLYQVEGSNGKFFYAIYSTGVGFSDENYFLQDFNSLVFKRWLVE